MDLRDKLLENLRRHGPMTFEALVAKTAEQWHLKPAAVEWELRSMMEYRYIQKNDDGLLVGATK